MCSCHPGDRRTPLWAWHWVRVTTKIKVPIDCVDLPCLLSPLRRQIPLIIRPLSNTIVLTAPEYEYLWVTLEQQ